jgi:hypothetical protein
MAAAAGATSPKRLRVYSSAATADVDYSNGAGSGKRVGTHNGSFHCDEALGCFLIRLTSQFAGADVVRTRDSQVCRFVAGSIGMPFPPKKMFQRISWWLFRRWLRGCVLRFVKVLDGSGCN